MKKLSYQRLQFLLENAAVLVVGGGCRVVKGIREIENEDSHLWERAGSELSGQSACCTTRKT